MRECTYVDRNSVTDENKRGPQVTPTNVKYGMAYGNHNVFQRRGKTTKLWCHRSSSLAQNRKKQIRTTPQKVAYPTIDYYI